MSGKVSGQLVTFVDLKIDRGIKLDIRSPLAVIKNLLIFYFVKNVYITGSRSFLGFFRDILFLLPYLIFRKVIYIHIHGDDLKNILDSKISFVVNFVYKRATIIVANQEQVKYLQDSFMVKYVPNYSRFNMDKCDWEKPNKRIYAYVSSISIEKGIFDWFEIVKAINWSSEFIIAGPLMMSGNDIIEFQNQISLIRAQGKNITWKGELDANNLEEVYRTITDLIYVSKHPTENMPLVLLEAAAMGVMLHVTSHRHLNERFGLLTNSINTKMILSNVSLIKNYKQSYVIDNMIHVNRNYSFSIYNRKINKIINGNNCLINI